MLRPFLSCAASMAEERQLLQVARKAWRDALHGRVMHSMIPRAGASLIAEMKDMAEQNRRLKKMHAKRSAEGGAWRKALRPSIAWQAIAEQSVERLRGERWP